MKQLEVVFCGNSVYLSGLAASLRPDPRLRVTQLDAPPAKALGDLRLLAPHAIIAEESGPDAVAALTQADPRLAVIHIDAASDTLAVLTGRRPGAAPVADLTRVLLDASLEPAHERTDYHAQR